MRETISFSERSSEVLVDIDVKRHIDVGIVVFTRLAVLLAALRTQHITLVSAFFDLAPDATPMCGQRDMPLHELLQPKALRGVVRLLFAHARKQVLELLARKRRLEALDTHEPLFVEHLQAAQPSFRVTQQCVELLLIHDLLQGRYAKVVERQRNRPVVKSKVVVPWTTEWVRIRQRSQQVLVGPGLYGSAATLNFHAVGFSRYHLVCRPHHAVSAMLVEPSEYVERVVPATEDHHVARRRITSGLRFGHTVAEYFNFDVAISVVALHVELYAHVVRQHAPQPQRLVACAGHLELAIDDFPGTAGVVPGSPDVFALEVI